MAVTISQSDDPVKEIKHIREQFDGVALDRRKISNTADNYHYASAKEKMLFVVGKIFDYGFEKFPMPQSPKCTEFIGNIFKDTDRVDNGPDISPDFIRGVRHTRQLIRDGEIQGWEHIENAIVK